MGQRRTRGTRTAGHRASGRDRGHRTDARLKLVDGRGRLLRPAILWNDGRAASQRRWIEDRIGVTRLLELTANRAVPGFIASNLLSVREHEPDTFRGVRRIMLPKNARMRLSGRVLAAGWTGLGLAAAVLPALESSGLFSAALGTSGAGGV